MNYQTRNCRELRDLSWAKKAVSGGASTYQAERGRLQRRHTLSCNEKQQAGAVIERSSCLGKNRSDIIGSHGCAMSTPSFTLWQCMRACIYAFKYNLYDRWYTYRITVCNIPHVKYIYIWTVYIIYYIFKPLHYTVYSLYAAHAYRHIYITYIYILAKSSFRYVYISA